MTEIAILGAGFSGLATAWHLMQQTLSDYSIKITLFDEKGIGGGASGIAAGLLHPYAGAHAKLNPYGREGVEETLQLLKIANDALGTKVFHTDGILRLAVDQDQYHDYKICSEKYEDVQWLEAQECHKEYSLLASCPGIFIKEGITVEAPLYLEGLWLACQKKGVKFEKKLIHSLDELKDFDIIIIATGAAAGKFEESKNLPISQVRGQVLEFEWPTNIPPLPFPINSYAYLLMDHSKTKCILGSTFERDTISTIPDPEYAMKELLPKLTSFLPTIQLGPLIKCSVGIRASTPQHLPLIKKIHKSLWIITGMGSKGLLYHALYAKKLATDILNDLNKRY